MATSVIWLQNLLLHPCSSVYSTNKKALKMFVAIHTRNVSNSLSTKTPRWLSHHARLHSSKKSLEFGLLSDHNPLICTLYLKEIFINTLTSFSFFSTNDQNFQMNNISNFIIIYLFNIVWILGMSQAFRYPQSSSSSLNTCTINYSSACFLSHPLRCLIPYISSE